MCKEAWLWVDNNFIDARKCINSYSCFKNNIKSTDEIKLGYRYLIGYGYATLFVYVRDTADGEVYRANFYNDPSDGYDEEDHENYDYNTYKFSEDVYGRDVEVYICLKGELYENPGPFFTSDGSIRWIENDQDAKIIRASGLINNVKKYNMADIIRAHVKIQYGKYEFVEPKFFMIGTLDKSDTENIIKKLDYFINRHYDQNNKVPLISLSTPYINKIKNLL